MIRLLGIPQATMGMVVSTIMVHRSRHGSKTNPLTHTNRLEVESNPLYDQNDLLVLPVLI